MSEAKFQMHTYGRQAKHQILPLESFDPRPEEYHGTTAASLDHFLEAIKGLCMSLFLTSQHECGNCDADIDTPAPTPVEYEEIRAEVKSFKESSSVSEADICRIEKEQRDSLKWFQLQRFRITASNFGAIR